MSLEIHYNVLGVFRSPMADVELAKAAVEAGFEGVWIGDHFLPWIDSSSHTHHILPWFGTVMNEIPSVPVGTSVTCPIIRYRPPLLAQAISTLDHMYPGRFNLAVGIGEAVNEAHFTEEWPGWRERTDMLIEAIDVMRLLFTSSEFVSFEGAHYDYADIKLYTRPRTPIPIHWAAWGPKSARLAGRHADHLFTFAPVDHIRETLIPAFKKGLDDVDRSFEEAEVTTEFAVNVGDPDELVNEIRDRGEYVPIDTELDTPDPREIHRVGRARLEEMDDEEIRDLNHITADPDDIVEAFEALESAGVTRVNVSSNCGDPRHTLKVLGDHVLPRF